MPASAEKERFMRAAIRLAKKGRGMVSPNPLVGAILAKGNKTVASGYHHYYGGPHAEIDVLSKAQGDARGADLYINLEPCCHIGKTPPCVDALIEHGIRRVFIGMQDPNPLVSGKGIKKLTAAGIQVEVGILEEECRRLNEAFIKYITRRVPFVILKLAATLDGKLATTTGDSQWITCEASRRFVHRLRSQVDAVLVGIGTVLKDDPLLTARLYRSAKKNPVRIIVDSSLKIPLNSKLLSTARSVKTIIATSRGVSLKKVAAINHKGATVFHCPTRGTAIDLKKLMQQLGSTGISSILIEGGSEISASALADGVVDKIYFLYAPKIIGGKHAVSMVGGNGISKLSDALVIRDIKNTKLGQDLLIEGYLHKN